MAHRMHLACRYVLFTWYFIFLKIFELVPILKIWKYHMHIKMPDVQVLRENGLILLPGTEWAAVSTNCPFRQSSSSGFGTLYIPPHPGPVLLIPITDWFLKVSVTLWLYCHHLTFFFFPLNICGFFSFHFYWDNWHATLSCTDLIYIAKWSPEQD